MMKVNTSAQSLPLVLLFGLKWMGILGTGFFFNMAIHLLIFLEFIFMCKDEP